MADKILETWPKLEVATLNDVNFYVRETSTGRVLVGGENFGTQREASRFAQAATKAGYKTLEPVPYNPLSDEKVQVTLADEAKRKSRWEAKKLDDYLMSESGFNEED